MARGRGRKKAVQKCKECKSPCRNQTTPKGLVCDVCNQPIKAWSQAWHCLAANCGWDRHVQCPPKPKRAAKKKPPAKIVEEQGDETAGQNMQHMDGVPKQKRAETTQERLHRESCTEAALNKLRLWDAKKAKLPPIVRKELITELTPKGHYVRMAPQEINDEGWQCGNVVGLDMPVLKNGSGWCLYSALDVSACHPSGKTSSYRHHQRVWLARALCRTTSATTASGWSSILGSALTISSTLGSRIYL